MSFQRIEVLGVIGKNAEVKTIGQKQYIAFSVSVSNGKDAQGNFRDSTWFDVLYAYNQQTQAWMLPRLCAKSTVYVSGRVDARAYIDKNQQAVGALNLFATNVEPIGVIERDNQQNGGYQQAPPQQGYSQNPPQGGYYPQQGYQQAPPQGGYYPQQGFQAPPQQGYQQNPQQGENQQKMPF